MFILVSAYGSESTEYKLTGKRKKTTVNDVIQIVPAQMNEPARRVIEDHINVKYANKVVQNVGWCVCFYDLLSATDGLIGHGTGIVNVNVTFRLLTFRPFRGEVIEAKIAEATSTQIRLTNDFFDDIIVKAPEMLPPNSHFSAEEGVWIWTEDDQPYYFDKNEKVRVRIEDEVWTDQAPVGGIEAGMIGGVKQELGGIDGAESVKEREDRKGQRCPWRLIGSMGGSGLGVTRWWMGGGDEEEGAEEE